MEKELPVQQAGFRKDQTRDQIANLRWILEKSYEYENTLYMCFIDYKKAFDCMNHSKLRDKDYKQGCESPTTGHVPTDIAILERDDFSKNTY